MLDPMVGGLVCMHGHRYCLLATPSTCPYIHPHYIVWLFFPRYRISHKISLLSTSHPTLNSFTTDSEFFGWCRLLQVRRCQRRLMAQAPFEVTYWQWFAWVFGWSFCVLIAHPDQILNWHNSICLLPPVPSHIPQIMLAFGSGRASAWRCWRSKCLL